MTEASKRRVAIDLSPLRILRRWRILFLGHFVAQMGAQAAVIVVAWQVKELTGSPAAVGLIGAVELVPMIFLSLFGNPVDLGRISTVLTIGDPSIFTPLPDDWQVGAADVVKSTDALRAGRYKDVNMAGAAVVGAVRNALGGQSFPFVFGGDGAVLAVPPDMAEAARAAMAALRERVSAHGGSFNDREYATGRHVLRASLPVASHA